MNKVLQASVIYTLDHNNLDTDQFQNILLQHSITSLIDIRSQPQSIHQPHFDESPLRASMTQCKIDYHLAGRQLGGHREQQPDSKHIALNSEQQAFADYMESHEFERAANQLISLSSRTCLALFCSTDVTDNCYQFMIADYLILKGIEVQHINSSGDAGSELSTEKRTHILNLAARRESTELIYDRHKKPKRKSS